MNVEPCAELMIRDFQMTALTDIWTGDANTAQSKKADRLIPTGLLGSIRWWFEALVRGLGGSPCDPSANQKVCVNSDHCVVCELFGCTGWARKFRFDVCNAEGAVITSQLTKGTKFLLRFTPLRAVKAEEWALLEITLRLISEFGALGGKTVLKPSDEAHRDREPHHRDFGLVSLIPHTPPTTFSRDQLRQYVGAWAKKSTARERAWASCSHMWFVEGQYLTRQNQTTSTFNRVLGRDERKACCDCGAVHLPPSKCPKTKRHPKRFSDAKPSILSQVWLAGGIGDSKKVFSFKSPARTFGFVQQLSDLSSTLGVLRRVWGLPPSSDVWFLSGEALLNRLWEIEKVSK